MIARHYGQCKACFERITPGDIIWSRPKGWMHRTCAANDDSAQFVKANPNWLYEMKKQPETLCSAPTRSGGKCAKRVLDGGLCPIHKPVKQWTQLELFGNRDAAMRRYKAKNKGGK